MIMLILMSAGLVGGFAGLQPPASAAVRRSARGGFRRRFHPHQPRLEARGRSADYQRDRAIKDGANAEVGRLIMDVQREKLSRFAAISMT